MGKLCIVDLSKTLLEQLQRMRIQTVLVGIFAGLTWASAAELKEQEAGQWDPRYNRISRGRSGNHHHHPHHAHRSSSSSHHRRPCHKSSDSHCLNPFEPPHRHSHGHHHHHHHSHNSHHYQDHFPPEEAQAKVLQLTSQLQQYFSTCPLGPWPSDLFNPFATIGIYGRHCSNLNLGCCYTTGNLTSWFQDLYSGLCQVAIPITWINQQPPSAEILCNGTAVVTFVEVRHTALTLDTHQMRYYWQRRIGCDYWLQYVESKDVSCPVFDDLPACSDCPPP